MPRTLFGFVVIIIIIVLVVIVNCQVDYRELLVMTLAVKGR